jgi:hypothetical protein
MEGKLLNSFLLGADPELILLDPPALINGSREHKAGYHYGYDHGGYVIEPHPSPSLSARTVCANIKKSLDVISNRFPSYRLRAGAYYRDPDRRDVTLGGHVHLDLQHLSAAQLKAMDIFATSLEALEILPSKENKLRCGSGHGYGKLGDIRAEHGHVEYRSLCSWLFSRKTSMLCITGIKLAAVAPDTVKSADSYTKLLRWFEEFKGKDDDVDWILDREYFASSLEAKPDANVKAVWKVDPDKAKEWEQEVATMVPTNIVNMADLERRMLTEDYFPSGVEYEEIRRRSREGSERAATLWRLIHRTEILRAARYAQQPLAATNNNNMTTNNNNFENLLGGILQNPDLYTGRR